MAKREIPDPPRRSRDSEKFQSFGPRPKIKVARESAGGAAYVDYKDTESLRKLLSGNGKISTRKRSGSTSMEQRKIATAIKRARYMALLPYVSPTA